TGRIETRVGYGARKEGCAQRIGNLPSFSHASAGHTRARRGQGTLRDRVAFFVARDESEPHKRERENPCAKHDGSYDDVNRAATRETGALNQLVLLQLLVKRRDGDAEHLGRANFVPVDLRERLLNGDALEILQCLAGQGQPLDTRRRFRSS